MHTNRITLAFLLVLSLLGLHQATAQHWFQYAEPPREFDWQLFSPELDLDCPPQAAQGYFGTLERTHTWMIRPNRAPVGHERNARAFFPANVNFVYTALFDAAGNVIIAADDSSLLLPVVNGGTFGIQHNTVDDAYTQTGKGWGWRSEFGYVNGRNGWMISIHDSNIGNSARYGVDHKRQRQLEAAQGLDGVDGLNDPDGVGRVNPIAPVEGFQSIPGVDGLYTVHMFFDDPQNLLLGYTDVFATGNPDDLDGDGVAGQLFFPIIDADGNIIFIDDFFNGDDPDNPFGVGDRVRIGVVFDEMFVENEMEVSGIEIAALRRKRPLGEGALAEVYLGAKYLEMDDNFYVSARGGALSDTQFQHNAVNRMVGPMAGFRIAKTSRRWTTQFHGRFMAGANFTTIRQDGYIGDHLTRSGILGAISPGLPNNLGGNAFFHRFSDEFFSPTGELRVEVAARLTKYLSFRAGWTGLIAGNVTRASNTVRYAIPDLGIVHSNESVVSSMASLGVELNR